MRHKVVTLETSRDAVREQKVSEIHTICTISEFAGIPSCDGRIPRVLESFKREHPYVRRVEGLKLKDTELGIWYSHMSCWQAALREELLVFEDDAILAPNFMNGFSDLYRELPQDYDTFSLFVPNNQEQDFYYNTIYDADGEAKYSGYPPRKTDKDSIYLIGSAIIAKAYQGYSLVCTLYSPKGADKLLTLARKHGMHAPVDCFVFKEAHRGNLISYAPRPTYPRLVSVDWNAPSIREGK